MSHAFAGEVIADRHDSSAVERLLRALPDWFGIEESVEQYVRDADLKPTYLAVDTSGQVVGALLLTRHNPRSAEIHLLVVDPDHHRQGIGAALVERVEADLTLEGVEVLEVKTQGPSEPDENYAATLKFYLAIGFIPLEEIFGLWPRLPCLILVKPLWGGGTTR
jgi:ribosomal protein S18 acetylase RimI-like enzyme